MTLNTLLFLCIPMTSLIKCCNLQDENRDSYYIITDEKGFSKHFPEKILGLLPKKEENSQFKYFSLKYKNRYIIFKEYNINKDLEKKYQITLDYSENENTEKIIYKKIELEDNTTKTLETKQSIIDCVMLLKHYAINNANHKNDYFIYYSSDIENNLTVACDLNNFRQTNNKGVVMIYKKTYYDD
jgi:hypothetical protein